MTEGYSVGSVQGIDICERQELIGASLKTLVFAHKSEKPVYLLQARSRQPQSKRFAAVFRFSVMQKCS